MADPKDAKPPVDKSLVADDKVAEAVITEAEVASTATSIQRIPSRAIRKFYSEDGATIEVGQAYEFVRTPNNFYPWPNMRPEDTSLNADLKAEYEAARKRIGEEAKARSAAAMVEVLIRLANNG